MTPPAYEVADILNRNKQTLSNIATNGWKLRTLHAIRICRTSALGGHVDECDNPSCQKLHLSYNSCRNRHCPKCQGHKREEWIRQRETDLVNVPYYHVVFTLPEALNSLCLAHSRELYNLLFKTAWSVIKSFAQNTKFLGASTGMIAILHTWGQNLSLHPHLHCIVPGGGITASGKWKLARGKGKYLFPVKAMSKVFRARFVQHTRKQFDLPKAFYDQLFEKKWVVYCKCPFYSPMHVVEYLGRYTHKIAISNHRLVKLDNKAVTFSLKNYRKGGQRSLLQLPDPEFIRRFALHILPKGFVRIRHFGILSSTLKKNLLLPLKQKIGTIPLPEKPPLKINVCPSCKAGRLVTVFTFKQRGPPHYWIQKVKNQKT